MAFTPVFPLHVVDKGFSYFTLGILMAVPSVLSIFVRIPIGSTADRIGKKRVILFGLAMQSLSFVLLGVMSSMASLFMVRILQGVAVSFVPPIVTVAIYDLAIPANKGKTFGVFFTSIGLAMVSGPLITSLLLGFLDLNSFFMFLSLFPAAGFIIYLVGAREKESQIKKYLASE